MKSCLNFFSNFKDRISRRRSDRSCADAGDSCRSHVKELQCPQVETIDQTLDHLPQELFEKISVHLSYGNVAQLRLVSRKMDALCSEVLNSGFHKLQCGVDALYKATQPVQLPLFSVVQKRPNPLAWKADLFDKVSGKLDRLLLVFGEHIDKKHCCFFAGSLLDEFYRCLWCITVAKNTSECHVVLADLDKSCRTAKQYFVEHLKPSFPSIMMQSESDKNTPSMHSVTSVGFDSTRGTSSNTGGRPSSNMVLKSQNRKLVAECRAANQKLTAIRREVRDYRSRLADQQKLLSHCERRLVDTRNRYEKSSRKLRAEVARYRAQGQGQRQTKVTGCRRAAEEEAMSDGGRLSKGLEHEEAGFSGVSTAPFRGNGAGEATKTNR